jgi:hypothetical protein
MSVAFSLHVQKPPSIWLDAGFWPVVTVSAASPAVVYGQQFTGDPATIALANAETIVLQYGPPFGTPPKSPIEP